MKETKQIIRIISFKPISERLTSKAFHKPSVKSVRRDIIGTFWRQRHLQYSFSHLGLSVNSLKRKILNKFHSFTEEFHFLLLQQTVLHDLPMEIYCVFKQL